jgi:hypothetical protein
MQWRVTSAKNEGRFSMENNNQAALDLFSNYSACMLTDDELLAIHGGSTDTSAGGAPPADSGMATHAGHVAAIVGASATVGGAIGAAAGIPGGPPGITAGGVMGGAVGGGVGVVLAVGNEMYEHGQAMIHAGSAVIDAANGVAEFYATADVG